MKILRNDWRKMELKTPPYTAGRTLRIGFTLVELLVVVAIIAILASRQGR